MKITVQAVGCIFCAFSGLLAQAEDIRVNRWERKSLFAAEDAKWLVEHRETCNGEYHGLTMFAPPGWGSRTDCWPIASYARGLLEYGMKDRFKKVMDAMLNEYLSDDTFTAYEQVYNEGNPRRPGAPACVPAQLAYPRMLAWSFKYVPWKSLEKGDR